MIQRFKDFIAKENLLLQTDKILIAVSGGVDSIVLCNLFHEAKIEFGITHCNFNLRGKESDGDERFVKALAMKYDVEFYSKAFDTAIYSKENGISIQMAARDLRYLWFEEIRKEEGYNFIAIAHHQNDVVETILMNLVKGTGIAGLHGILAKKDNIIRPLLFAIREEIEAYAMEHKLKYREDSSNQSDKYLRNKIRNQVVPVLKEINPKLEKTFMENVERIKAVEEIYESQMEDLEHNIVKNYNGNLEIRLGIRKNLTPSFLHSYLVKFNFLHDVINEIVKASEDPVSGKQFFSPTHRIIVDRSSLILIDLKDPYGEEEFIIDKKNGSRLSATYDIKHFNLLAINYIIPKEIKDLKFDNLLHMDEVSIQYPLTIRRWKAGDFFYPLGMDKKKKISDFLIDKKVPLNKKENTFVVLSGNDIICVLGHRIDNRYRVTDATKKVLTISYKEK